MSDTNIKDNPKALVTWCGGVKRTAKYITEILGIPYNPRSVTAFCQRGNFPDSFKYTNDNAMNVQYLIMIRHKEYINESFHEVFED